MLPPFYIVDAMSGKTIGQLAGWLVLFSCRHGFYSLSYTGLPDGWQICGPAWLLAESLSQFLPLQPGKQLAVTADRPPLISFRYGPFKQFSCRKSHCNYSVGILLWRGSVHMYLLMWAGPAVTDRSGHNRGQVTPEADRPRVYEYIRQACWFMYT